MVGAQLRRAGASSPQQHGQGGWAAPEGSQVPLSHFLLSSVPAFPLLPPLSAPHLSLPLAGVALSNTNAEIDHLAGPLPEGSLS